MRPSSPSSPGSDIVAGAACGVTRHRLAALAAGIIGAAVGQPCHALQLLDARDGVAIEAILSVKEPTRIRIDGAPITDVFGNIHSSHCGTPDAANAATAAQASASVAGMVTPAVNPQGEIVLECDRDKGEVYIRPVDPSTAAKPVNLFISSASATYTLVLRRSDTPADTIVIRDRSQRVSGMGEGQGPSGRSGRLGPSAHHVRAMKSMLVAMASDRVPPDIRVDELNRPVQLWADARFTLMRRYEGRGLLGEKYLLHNVGLTDMALAEQAFDRPDIRFDGQADIHADGQVIGVAVEKRDLRPGESTNVFVILRGNAR
jgi:conjugal transfer pilus assembly protein TraK